MRKVVATAIGAMILALGVGGAWADAKVTITREESKPQTVEIKVGEYVEFVNAAGGMAHVWFGGNETIRFYVGKGGSRVKFDKPATYEYAVHISGMKAHAHTGTVVVK